MDFGQRIVLVDEMHLVAVALGDERKQAGMEDRAVGTLQVVEADNQHRRGFRAAARRTIGRLQQGARVRRHVVLVELRHGLAIVRD